MPAHNGSAVSGEVSGWTACCSHAVHLVKMNAIPKDPAMPNLLSAASTVRPAPADVTAQPMHAAPPSSMPPAMVLCLRHEDSSRQQRASELQICKEQRTTCADLPMCSIAHAATK